MRFSAVILLVALAAPAGADILHLRSGERLYGTIVSENDRQVVFRVWLAEGSTVARSFTRAEVARVEHSSVDRPPNADSAALGPPAVPDEPGGESEDYSQMTREAFELLDDGDSPAALRALQRVVVRAPESALAALSEQVRAARGIGLDELLAQTRIAALLKTGNGLRVTYATPYESRALAIVLENRQAEALTRQFDGRTIAQWAKKPDDYKDLKPSTREMVEAARIAAGAIGGRLKYDARLRIDREERERVTALRAELSRFVAKVTAIKGYTTQSEEPRDLEADRKLIEQSERAAAAKNSEREKTGNAPQEEQP